MVILPGDNPTYMLFFALFLLSIPTTPSKSTHAFHLATCFLKFPWISSYNRRAQLHYALGWNLRMNCDRMVTEATWCHSAFLPFPFSTFGAHPMRTQPIKRFHTVGILSHRLKENRDEKQLWAIRRKKSSETQEERWFCREWQFSTPHPRHINGAVTLLKFNNEKSTSKFTQHTSLKWRRLPRVDLKHHRMRGPLYLTGGPVSRSRWPFPSLP